MEHQPVIDFEINYHYINNYDDDLTFYEMIRRYLQDVSTSDNNIRTTIVMEIVYNNFLRIDRDRWDGILYMLPNNLRDIFNQHLSLNNNVRNQL